MVDTLCSLRWDEPWQDMDLGLSGFTGGYFTAQVGVCLRWLSPRRGAAAKEFWRFREYPQPRPKPAGRARTTRKGWVTGLGSPNLDAVPEAWARGDDAKQNQ